MVLRKRRKVRRMRRTRVHGYGRVSGGHRKGGQRGGVGRAGVKGHHKIYYLSKGIPVGRTDFGFFNHTSAGQTSTINVGLLNERAEKIASKEGDHYNIDLTALGYDKLLGSGRVTHKLKITVAAASAGAIEKIEAAGGNVVLPES